MIEFIFRAVAEIFGFTLKATTWLCFTEQTLPEISAIGGIVVSIVATWVANFALKKWGVHKRWCDVISTIITSLATIALTGVFYHFEHITALELATIILAIIGIGLFATRKFIENRSNETYRSNAEACY